MKLQHVILALHLAYLLLAWQSSIRQLMKQARLDYLGTFNKTRLTIKTQLRAALIQSAD